MLIRNSHEDIVTIGAFKSQAAAWLNRLKGAEHPIVITQNGKPVGVLLSPAEFDRLQKKERFLESVAKGLADAEADRVMDSSEVRRRLAGQRVGAVLKIEMSRARVGVKRRKRSS